MAMKIQYSGQGFSGALEVPDAVGLPIIHRLQMAIRTEPERPVTRSKSSRAPRSIVATYRLDTGVDVERRKLSLQLSNGEHAEFSVPVASDRVAAEHLFDAIKAWGQAHHLSDGQVRGVNVLLNQRFAIWRRGPR